MSSHDLPPSDEVLRQFLLGQLPPEEHLAKCKALRRVELHGGKVTEAGIKKLAAACPTGTGRLSNPKRSNRDRVVHQLFGLSPSLR